MNPAEITEIINEAIIVTLKIGGPVMLLSLVVGLIISLFQALTQIQEATLTFVPKMIVIFLALMFLMPYMMSTLSEMTYKLTDRIIQGG